MSHSKNQTSVTPASVETTMLYCNTQYLQKHFFNLKISGQFGRIRDKRSKDICGKIQLH